MTGVGAIVTVGDANDAPLQSGSERNANQIGGTFVVKTHDGNRTADLPYGITKEDMQDALNSILGANSVLVTRNAPGVPGDNVANIGPAGGYVWHVEFSHSRVGGDVPMLLVEANNITGTGTSLVVTEDVKGNELTGTFQLASWDGSPDQTGELLYYSTASQVENQLESLGSIGNIEVSSSVSEPQVNGRTWLVTFHSNYHSGTDSTETWASPPAQVPGVSKSWGMNIGNIELMKCNIRVGGQNILTSSNSGIKAQSVVPYRRLFKELCRLLERL